VKQFIFQLTGSQSSVSMNLSQAPPVPSLTSTSAMGTNQSPAPNAVNQGPPSTGVAATPVPQLISSSTQSGAPVSPYINGTGAAVYPSNQQQAQASAVPSSTVGSSGQAFPIQQQQGANHQAGNTMASAKAGTMIGGAAVAPGGTDFGGIPSPVTDQKSGIPNPNGMPTAPMTSGPPHQQHQPHQQTQMPYNQQPQMQQVPPHGHMQYPPQMPQGQGQVAMPQQMPHQAQFMYQQTPQAHGQIQPQMAQFPQHFPQQPPHMAGQPFPPQQQQFPQQQQQQAPQQQQQQAPPQQQQFPQQQQQQQPPPSPLSPKGNPFDFY
jgi:hypothetical protein